MSPAARKPRISADFVALTCISASSGAGRCQPPIYGMGVSGEERARKSMRFVLLVSSLFLLGLTVVPALADGAAMPEHKITQSESYIMLEPMYATILDGAHPNGMLMVAIGLDIPDAGLRNDATRAMPILRDAYVRNLMS